jgi:heat shock protein HslJ
MLSMITVAGLGLSLAALAATPSFAASGAGAVVSGAASTAVQCRTLDFEKVDVTPLAVTGSVPATARYRLTVTGTRPATNVRVSLVPLVYVKQPAYWGITVTGCASGTGLPVLTNYTATLDLTGTMGTCGIEVIGATRNQTVDLAGCTKAPLTGTRWTLDPASLGVPIPAGQPITANFSDTTLSGYTSCNTYSSRYSAGADGTFTLGPIMMTARACGPVAALAEGTYLKRLFAVTGYSVSAKELQLLGADRTGLLRFTPAPPAV